MNQTPHTNQSLLEGICRRGVLAATSVRYWRGCKKLNPEDLGLDPAHVIKLKGPYEIAVEQDKENPGSYGLTTDWWDGHVAKEVGTGYGRLLQSYGVHKTAREAATRGLRHTRRIEAEGFQGKGCEAATKAIEDALGKPRERTRKQQFWRPQHLRNEQQLGGEG